MFYVTDKIFYILKLNVKNVLWNIQSVPHNIVMDLNNVKFAVGGS